MPYECIIAPQIKRQKKTSKYRVINWIYKNLYGYEYESTIQSDVEEYLGLTEDDYYYWLFRGEKVTEIKV